MIDHARVMEMQGMGDGEVPGDVLTETDKRLILRTAEERLKRWPLLGEDRALVVKTIRDTLNDPGSSRRTKLMATRVAERLEAQNQNDDHLEAKWGRIDAGQPTESVRHEGIAVEFLGAGQGAPGAGTLPAPAALPRPALPAPGGL